MRRLFALVLAVFFFNSINAQTPGSVLFTGSDLNSTEDNSKFFWDNSAKSLNIGTNTSNTSAILNLSATDKGILFPRLTNSQKLAIATPATGLTIYNTTAGAFEYWDGTTWREIFSPSTTNSSAILDLTSTAKGILIPRMTTTQRDAISGPAIGLQLYNTTTNGFEYYNGSIWVGVGSGNAGNNWGLTGNTGTNTTTNYIGTSDDVGFNIKTNNTSRIFVDANGLVGLGTVTPACRLHVNGQFRVGGNGGSANTIYMDNTQMLFYDNLATVATHIRTNGVTYFNGGNIGIGTSTPIAKFEVATSGALQLSAFSVYSNTASDEPIFYMRRGRGTLTGPLTVSNGDIIGSVRFASQKSNVVGDFTTVAKIESVANGTQSATSLPTDLKFYTTAANSIIPALAMTIASTGNVGINSTTPNASAYLDIAGTTRGLLIPRMTTVQRDAITSPADGLMIYNTSTQNFNFYSATAAAWKGYYKAGDNMGNITTGAIQAYGQIQVFNGQYLQLNNQTNSVQVNLQFNNNDNWLVIDRPIVVGNIYPGTTGMGSNVSASSLNLNGGLGTGMGNPGDIVFRTGTALPSPQYANYTQQTPSARWYIKGTSGTLSTSATPSETAILDIESTTKGILIPRMTIAQKNAIASPATGLLVFVTDAATPQFEYYSGTTTGWKSIANTGNTALTLADVTANGDTTPVDIKARGFRGSADAIFNGITVGRGGGNNQYNTAAGATALAVNSSGLANTAFGFWALKSNTTSSANTAFGYRTFELLNNGAGANTAVGALALRSLVSGINNTAIGDQALEYATGSNNTAIGMFAANRTSTGTDNVAIGMNALRYNEGGSSNTALGRLALSGNISGSKNVAIGYNAWPGSTTADGQLSIQNIIYGVNNTADGTNISTGKIGIGIKTPLEKLEVDGNVKATGLIVSGTGIEEGMILTSVDNTGRVAWRFPATLPIGSVCCSKWTLTGSDITRVDGNVGIGTTVPPTQKLEVVGNTLIKSGRLLIGDNQFNFPDLGQDPDNYRLAVQGTALFYKIKVLKSTSWPDYVFDKNYKLRTIDELEKFITENKHLPNVPSAADITKDGIDVGNNQAALLEKIEELTLYIIQQNKEIVEMKKEIKEIRKSNMNQ